MHKIFMIISFSFLAFVAKAYAANDIVIPEKCFESLDYCSTAEVNRDVSNIRFIELKFYAQISNEYGSLSQIEDQFLDFKSWPEYAASAQEINFISSGLLSSRTFLGKREVSQYARYQIQAPWPANQIDVVERTTYREFEASGNIDIFWKFFSDRDFAHQGIKRKDGTLKIKFIAPTNVYHVELAMEVVPITAYLTAARKSIRRAIASLFMGMFDIN